MKKFMELKPQDYVYARRKDASVTNFSIQQLGIDYIHLDNDGGYIVIEQFYDSTNYRDDRFMVIPISRWEDYCTSKLLYTPHGTQIEVAADKNYFIERFEEYLRNREWDAQSENYYCKKMREELEKIKKG